MPDARRPGRLFASLWSPMEGSGLFTPLRVGGYEVDGKTDRRPRRRASRQRQPSAASSRWSFRSATASPTRPASGKSPADRMSRTPGRTHTSASRRSASQTSPSYGPGARTSASRSGARERRPPLAPLAPCHSLTLAHQPRPACDAAHALERGSVGRVQESAGAVERDPARGWLTRLVTAPPSCGAVLVPVVVFG
jgi:hypothetical protein